jgi:transcriptional regulator with XRE-family HTH domain
MSIVNRLFEVRTQRGLTQQDVADRTGVSRVTVGRIDRNPRYRPKGKTMQDLARGLRLRIGDLFDDDEMMDEAPASHPFAPQPVAVDRAPPAPSSASSSSGRDLVAAGVTRVPVTAATASPSGAAATD